MNNPEVLAFSIVILLFSVILHEVMHGLVALKFGDHTAEHAGRLTLNPLPHIDPIGTLLLPIVMLFLGLPILGWAKPVPVNPLNFSDIRKGELFVSAAGIVANISLAVVAAILFRILGVVFPNPLVASLLIFTVTINLSLAVFNLLPIPPLDGSKVLMALLPLNLAREYQKLERFGFILLLLLVMSPIPIIGFILRWAINFLGGILLGI